MFGYAAGKIADSLQQNGGKLMAEPEGFIVKGRNGPLADGELDRYVKLRGRSGEMRTHWIYGDWRKGFPIPVAPSARDWALMVEDLALQLRMPVFVRLSEK